MLVMHCVSLCSYVPRASCKSTVVQLLKCKTGDLTGVNNYRAIALSYAISKIWNTFIGYIVSEDKAGEFQFSFKKRPSN